MKKSLQTGKVKWQYLASPNHYLRFFPTAVTPKQFLTFREVGSNAQTQAIALDRQTGKLLWSFAPYSDRPQLRLFAETEDDRFLMLDVIPR
jgi:hypothetical protein